jgi:hypothetical protein
MYPGYPIRPFYFRILLGALLLLGPISPLFGQAGVCNGGGCAFGGTQFPAGNFSNPGAAFTTITTCQWGGEYCLCDVVAGTFYEWSYCTGDGGAGAGVDAEMTLFNNANGALICYSDDVCGLSPKLGWTATFTGTVRVYTTQFPCATNNTCQTLVWRSVSGTPGDLITNPIALGPVGCATNYSNSQNTSVGYTNNIGQTSADVFYSFSLAQTTTVNISTCGSAFDTYLHVLNGAGTIINSNDDGGPLCAGLQASLQLQLAAGNYFIVVEGFGTATGTYTLNVAPYLPATPTTIAATPNPVCPGNAVTLSATGSLGTGATFGWFTGGCGTTAIGTGASITVNPNVATTYFVRAQNNCSSSACLSTTVNIGTVTASISGNTTICQGASTTLTASGGGTYLWSTGANTASISASTAGTYTVTATNNGCTGSASVSVTVNSLPSPGINGTLTFCPGSNTTLTATGGGTYVWSTGANTAAINVNAAGTYRVTVTGANTCTASAAAAVTALVAPTAGISGTLSFCPGNSTALTATGGTSYLWSTGANTAGISVNTAGLFSVTVTGANACTATASANVTQNTLPSATISGTLSFCPGTSTILTASGGTTYLWSNGTNTAALTVNAAGTYTVTVTNAQNCTASVSATATQNPVPSPSISGNTSICSGQSTTLTASGGTAYSWSTGAATADVVVSTASTFTVTVTNAQNCTATASSTVTVNPIPRRVFRERRIFVRVKTPH